MPSLNLILSVPQGAIVATNLGVEALAWHRSPGSAKHYRGRSVFVDLAVANGKPAFEFLSEGGWRDARADSEQAIAAVSSAGKRTKTALSNNAFSCTPLAAYRHCYLVKTGGQALELSKPTELARYTQHTCDEQLSSAEVARAIGKPEASRQVHLYMVLAPAEFLLLSNLSPEEYVWYATHRPGKMFRQVMFAELTPQAHLIADSVFEAALRELENPTKKTKTLVSGDCLNRIGFREWLGYADRAAGLYVGDRTQALAWRFPEIPSSWERADG